LGIETAVSALFVKAPSLIEVTVVAPFNDGIVMLMPLQDDAQPVTLLGSPGS
jgi:hypothetical protein